MSLNDFRRKAFNFGLLMMQKRTDQQKEANQAVAQDLQGEEYDRDERVDGVHFLNLEKSITQKNGKLSS
jgi:hypothetical protein